MDFKFISPSRVRVEKILQSNLKDGIILNMGRRRVIVNLKSFR
jgi:hypothetical protein